MKIQTNINHSGLLIVLLLALIVAVIFVVYFIKNAKNEYPKNQRITLSVVRFVYSFILTFLILSPLVEMIEKRFEKPILVIGVDNSESMQINNGKNNEIQNFLTRINQNFGDLYNIQTFAFSDRVEKEDSFTYVGLKSNYSAFFKEIEKRYYNQNLGAMLVVGDGIYNEGLNPEWSLDNFNIPVYTVGIGDTVVNPDQAVLNVTHNPNVFVENSFPLEVEINFTEYPFNNTLLSVSVDGKVVKSEEISVSQSNFYFSKEYQIKAQSVGIKNVVVSISPFNGEQNIQNNKYSFPIEVHDNRKSIIVFSEGPHPDIGAISETLQKQANFNLAVTQISTFNGDLNEYDLIVMNQLPSLKTQNAEIYETIRNTTIPLMFIVGPNTSIAALNNFELNFELQTALLTEESSPYFNETFSLFTIPPNIREIEKIYPPLLTFFTEYTYDSNFSILAYQKIKGIEMNYPLIMVGEKDQRKTGVIMGEGIWRWKLREYQYFNHQNGFNQIIVNLFNYLTIQNNRDQLKISFEKIVDETSPVVFKAQVYNEIFEPVINQEITLLVTDSTGNELNYSFDRNENNYSLNLGYLESGNYSFKAETSFADQLLTEEGSFMVSDVNIEQQNLHADFSILKSIAASSGGAFYTMSDSDLMLQTLKENASFKVKTHRDKMVSELINWRWLAILVILLFSLEWFLRKFWGLY